MKYALFGADAESCLLAQAAADLGHEIIWYGDVGNVDTATHPWVAGADQGDQWEVLCDPKFCDFVIVGCGEAPSALRIEQLIQLLKNDANVLASFPLTDSVLSYYEVDMARTENNAVLYHFNPLVTRTNRLDEFASWIANGHPETGRIEQLLCERPLTDRTRENDLWHFARDVELLDHIAGPLNRLGALGSPDEATTYSGLSVQLLGKTQVPVRWSVGPVDQSVYPTLTFIGERGRVRLEFDESSVFRSLDTAVPDEMMAATAATMCVKKFVEQLRNGVGERTTWPRALRAMELTDTIEISLRRGRMIDVHRQQLTEELAFRGTMSAVGCGMLMVLPPLLLFAGWLAQLIGLQLNKNWWAVGLLALLAFFLLLQFAPKLLIKKHDVSNNS
jgi:hypothetical protein